MEKIPVFFTRGMAFDLNALVPPGSGWTLSEALRINDKGQIIGVGQTQGQVRAFLLNPVESNRLQKQSVQERRMA